MLKKMISCCLVAIMLTATVGCGPNNDNNNNGAQGAGGNNGEQASETADRVLNVAFVMADTVESIFNRAMMMSLTRLQESGYPFELSYIENVTLENVESVLRTYAEGGYDVILCHAGISRDATIKIHNDYPDTVFLGSGNDWETPAPNVGAYDQALHEGCFLLGALAGLMTETNVLGCVGSFPLANVASEFNAFERGAKHVNPEVTVHVSYIESWYDPVKAKESANTQIAMGADIIFGERDGVIQACEEAGVYAMAEKLDQNAIGPDTVISSAVIRWDNAIQEVFDRVKAGTFENRYYTRYEGALADGMCELAPYYAFETIIAEETKQEIENLKAQIISGDLVVPFEP